MKPPPQSPVEMMKEAEDLGLSKLSNQVPPHGKPGQKPEGRKAMLETSYNSYKAGRSPTQATMILLGNCGAGKSSVINHLLQVEIAKRNAKEAETKSSTEYILKSTIKDLDVKDLKFSIVDTPGFNDTQGLAQDACNIKTIQELCESHEYLQMKTYPNIVLIALQATDTRFAGKASNFVKSLNTIKDLHIVDVKFPNVVVVFTWACALPHRNVDNWKKKLQTKAEDVNKILMETLGVTAPVVYIENAFDEFELDEKDDFTVLPDGTFQPSNLFNTMMDVMRPGKDQLGMLALRQLFMTKKEDLTPPEEGMSFHAKDSEKEQLDAREGSIFGSLMSAQLGLNLPDVMAAINDYVNKGDTLTSEEKTEAFAISAELVDSLGFGTIESLKCVTIGKLNQLMREPLSAFGVKLLKDVFQLEDTQQTQMLESLLYVGKGYNIFNDSTVTSAIFENSQMNETPFGIIIPDGFTMLKVNKSEIFMESFEDDKAFIKGRLASLGLDAQAMVDPMMFSIGAKAGFSKASKQSGSTSVEEKSYLLERRLFKLELRDLHHRGLKVTKAFRNGVERLPSKYKPNDSKVRAAYKDFFDNWGQYLVQSAYGGGSVETKVNVESTSSSKVAELTVRADLDAVFFNLAGGPNVRGGLHARGKKSDQKRMSARLATNHLKWSGGDHQYHKLNLQDVEPEDWSMWNISLASEPEVLTTNMKLTAIHNVVELVDPKKVQGCREAMEDLVGGKFIEMKIREEAEEMKKKYDDSIATTREDVAKRSADTDGPCFPGNANIFVNRNESILSICMKDVVVGDEVLTLTKHGKAIFSEVFMFNHMDRDAIHPFLKFSLDDGGELEISDRHMIFRVTDEEKKTTETIFAEDLSVGDCLLMFDQNSQATKVVRVTAVDKVLETGFYAPITKDGSIIVNNIWSSCYCEVPPYNLESLKYIIDAQSVAHFGMTPFRLMSHIGPMKKFLQVPEGQNMPPAITWAINNMLPYVK